MTDYPDKAVNYFVQGYNCSQSIVLAFCDKTGLDEKTALKISSSFGGGMGRLREVCGAVSGMFMVVGLLYGYSSPSDYDAKAEHYKLIQQLAEKFKQTNGSIVCRELLALNAADTPTPEHRTAEYYKKRPCTEIVRCAAEITAEYIKSRESTLAEKS